MNNSINANSSNEKILNIYNQIKSGIINLAPDFQRKLVWNDIHKENFIDTIINGYPFPEIYIADGEIDYENPTKITKWIVDGQQRLSTIVQYIDGNSNLRFKKIKPFNELSNKEKENFYYYNVVIRNLGHINSECIKEVFRRINSVNYALNAIEITNALYDGEYIKTANYILDNNKQYMEKFDLFSVNEQSRMRDLEFILTLMSIVEEKGYFSSTKRNEIYIKEYNDEYKNKDIIIQRFNNIFEEINTIIDDSYSMWTKKSNFLTMFIELYRFYYSGQAVICNNLKNIFSNFEKKLLSNKSNAEEKNIYVEYYLASIQGTGSKTARITRGKILQQFILQSIKENKCKD